MPDKEYPLLGTTTTCSIHSQQVPGLIFDHRSLFRSTITAFSVLRTIPGAHFQCQQQQQQQIDLYYRFEAEVHVYRRHLQMASKRRNTSSPECEPHLNQRLRTDWLPESSDESDASLDPFPGEKPQVDASTGQTGAFPGLTTSADQNFYGPANDGIDYLRMVRSEAKGIPQLLVAHAALTGAHESEEDYSDEEKGGYWDDDGTYTAKPLLNDAVPASHVQSAEDRYYSSLLAHFDVLRAKLKHTPPLSAIEKLTSSEPISFPNGNKNARSLWLHCLKYTYPNATQIACMDRASVLELGRLITTKIHALYPTTSALDGYQYLSEWIWAVLGKCPDRGELSSEEIADLRQLARSAIDTREVIQKMKYTALKDEEYRKEMSANGNEEDFDAFREEIKNARTRMATAVRISPSQIPGPKTATQEPTRKSPHVLIDAVVTIVGEVYGQRDLLEERHSWR